MKTKQYFVSTNLKKVEGKEVKLFSESERNLNKKLGLKKSKKLVYLFQANSDNKK